MPKLTEKQQKAFRDINQIQEMSPLEALKSGMGLDTPEQADIKRQILEQKKQDALFQMQPNLSPKELGEMRMKGGQVIQESKDKAKQDQINRLKESLSVDEDLTQFGDKDAEVRAESRRKYLQQLLNNK